MNQLFDINRFGLLVAKHWRENRNRYLLSLLAMGGIMLLWLAFLFTVSGYQPFDSDTQLMTYYGGLFIIGTLYASLLFSDLSSTSKGMNYLSLPASHLEKLLCGLLYVVVIFFVCYTALFYFIDWIAVNTSNALAVSLRPERSMWPKSEMFNVFVAPGSEKPGYLNHFLIFLLIYFAVQAGYIAGSIYFPRYSFIKTTISLSLFVLVILLFIGKVLYPMLPHGNFDAPTTFMVRGNNGQVTMARLPEWINVVLIGLLKYGFPVVFYLVTYFRLKEKEV